MKKSEKNKLRDPELGQLRPYASEDNQGRLEGVLVQGKTLSVPRGEWIVNTCRFEDCTFTGRFSSSDIMDAEFDRCDFSNADFSGSSFLRVKFSHCRLVGADFSGGTFRDVQISDSTGLLANWNACSHSRVKFSHSILKEASFNDSRTQHLEFCGCDLTEAELFHISLNGVDLSDSVIDGVISDPESLKGCEVSFDQAASLIRLFGLKVRA